MRSIVILAAMTALAAACSSTDSVAPTASPAAPRRAVSANGATVTSRSIDQYVWASCANGGAGETVHVTGELHYEAQSMQDASGVFHLNIKSATSGLTAVGLTSGTFFRGMMTEHVTSRAADYLNEDVRIADIIRFVAPGSGGSYSLIANSHFIVDQGNYVLWEQTWDEACR